MINMKLEVASDEQLLIAKSMNMGMHMPVLKQINLHFIHRSFH